MSWNTKRGDAVRTLMTTSLIDGAGRARCVTQSVLSTAYAEHHPMVTHPCHHLAGLASPLQQPTQQRPLRAVQ